MKRKQICSDCTVLLRSRLNQERYDPITTSIVDGKTTAGVMFFVLRSTFCLGLVFWAIQPESPGGPTPDIVKLPVAGIAATTNNYCQHNPVHCLNIASKLADAGKDVSIKTILAFAKTAAGPDQSPIMVKLPSQSTLTAEDLAIPPRR